MALGMAMLSCLHQTEITQQLQNGLSWTWTKPKSVISWLCVLVYDFRLNSGFLFGVVFFYATLCCNGANGEIHGHFKSGYIVYLNKLGN